MDPFEFGEFRYDADADKALAWFQEGVVDNVPPQESGGREAICKMVTKFLLMVAMANKLVGVPIMRTHHKDGVTTEWTGQPVYSVNHLFICGMNLTTEFDAQFTVIISVTVNVVHRHRREV